MDRELLRESEALFEQMHARDRQRAAVRMAREGLAALGDYERQLLDLPTLEDEAREQEKANRERSARRKAIAERLRPTDIVFRNEQLERLCEHAIDLAAEHHITIWLQHDGGGKADHEHRCVHVPPTTSEESYAVALHEYGHLLSPDADSRQFRHVLKDEGMLSPDGEIGAWAWCVKNALVFTRPMFDRLFDGLGVYYKDLATPDELDRIVTFIKWAALQISDRPLTCEELDARCDRLTKTTRTIAPPVAVDAVPSTFKGGWKAGEYLAGDVVMMAGSIWRARIATTALPAINDDWVLIARNKAR